MIILHSHGGLGNQVFQILAAKLLSFQHDVKKIQICHNDKYNHSFKLCDRFNIYGKPKGIIMFLSKLRLPKIFFRLNLSDKEYLYFYRFFLMAISRIPLFIKNFLEMLLIQIYLI